MKHKLTVFVIILALITLMAFPVYASTEKEIPITTTEVEVFNDGSYAIIDTTVEQSNISLLATTKTKSASRTYTYYSSNDTKEWDFTVKGTFSYDGSSAKATAVSTSYNIYVSGWKLSSRESSKSGATVSATGKFKYSLMTKTTTIGMKCSNTGTISAL